MPNYQKHIVYLSDEQRQELFTNGTITVNGQTVIYSDNDMYVTPQEAPVTDVQVNGESVVQDGTANIPFAGSGNLGVVKVGPAGGLYVNPNNGVLQVSASQSADVKAGTEGFKSVVPSHQHESTFYGLAKAAGADMKDIASTTVGVYPDAQKAAIQNMLGVSPMIAPVESDTTADRAYAIGEIFSYNGKLYQATDAIAQDGTINPSINCQEATLVSALPHDVQVNGSSVVQNGIAAVTVPDVSNFVAKTDYATLGSAGVIKVDNNQPLGIYINSLTGMARLAPATSEQLKSGTGDYVPISATKEHEATFYGLAKAAGDATQSQSSSQVGSYTDAAKAAIQKMLDAADQRVQNIYDNLTNSGTYTISSNDLVQGQWSFSTPASRSDRIRYNILIPVKAGMSVVYSSQTQDMYLGVLATPTSNTYISGLNGWNNAPVSNGVFNIPSDGWMTFIVRDHANTSLAITPADYNCTVTIKSSVKTALDSKVQDVQVNGTSILSQGVADVPKAGDGTLGVVAATANGTNGIGINTSNGFLFVSNATYLTKAGVNAWKPIVPSIQHESAFYGLAKAAGDSTQSASSNAVGTYTDNAKASIKSMLGVVDGSTGTVDITGTTPTITAVENTRYVCGEVSTLTFTPPSSGIAIVRFTSGTTPAVLTVPNTVIFPEWFDASDLEASRVYEICITDGVYGAVMSWPL